MLDKSRWHGLLVEVALEENMEFGAAIMLFMVVLKFPLNLSYGAADSQWALNNIYSINSSPEPDMGLYLLSMNCPGASHKYEWRINSIRTQQAAEN